MIEINGKHFISLGILSILVPKFKWCPSKITIEVNSYNRFVDLKHVLIPKLVAVDGAGQILPVSLSLNQLEHCACPYSQQNIHNVVATSKADKNGKIASCAMAVTVKGNNADFRIIWKSLTFLKVYSISICDIVVFILFFLQMFIHQDLRLVLRTLSCSPRTL